MPISINFLANVRDLLSGTDNVEQAFEGVSDSLDDLARDSDRAGDAMGDAITDGARDSERAVDRLDRSFQDMADTARRESRGAGDDIGSNVQRGTREASEGMDELNESAGSNAREVAASFDGSAQSIVDGFQGAAAEALAGFGPAGAVAGLALAAGIGLASSAIESAGELSEAARAKVGELTAELIETGTGTRSLQGLIDQLQQLATATEDGEQSLSDIRKQADDTDSVYRDLAQAYAGNERELAKVTERQREQMKASMEADAANREGSASFQAGTSEKTTKLGQLGDSLREATKLNDEAAEAEAAWVAAGGPEMEAKQARIESINEAYDEAAGSVDDFIDKETGIFDTQAYLDSMLAREQALRDYQQTLAESALSPEAKTFLESQGVEAAASFLAGYKTATPAQQAELNRIWSTAASDNSNAYAGNLQGYLNTAFAGLNFTGPKVNSKVEVDTTALDRVVNKSYTVVVDAITKFGKSN
jgi:hypothetical protein